MDDWRSYDDVAETYERVHASRFVQVADDLVAQAGIGEGHLLLDIGTGTGIAAEAATKVGARVVGIDESMGMLRVARRQRPAEAVAAAEAIDLPFRDGVFDAAIGSFVLAHFTKYETAIFDAMRVLKLGGTIGFSSWSDGVDAYQTAWSELVEIGGAARDPRARLRRGQALARQVPQTRPDRRGADRRRAPPRAHRDRASTGGCTAARSTSTG